MKTIITSLPFALALIVLCGNISSVVVAGQENPKLGHAEVSVSPLIQGVDAELIIRTLVQVNGTC